MISHGQDRITRVRKYWKVDYQDFPEGAPSSAVTWHADEVARAIKKAMDAYNEDFDGPQLYDAIGVTIENGYLVVSYITEEKE